MREQIDMGSLREQGYFLRLIGRVVDPPTHLYRDYPVLFSVQNEHWNGSRANVVFVAIGVCNEPLER